VTPQVEHRAVRLRSSGRDRTRSADVARVAMESPIDGTVKTFAACPSHPVLVPRGGLLETVRVMLGGR